MGLGAALLLGGALALSISQPDQDHIAPGVRVGRVELGGLSRAEALTRLRAAASSVPQVTVQAGTQRWNVPASRLGWAYDPQAELDAAAAASRSRTLLQKLRAVIGRAEPQLLPHLERVDEAQATAALTTLSAPLNSAPRNAAIVFDKTRYTVRPGAAGVQVDVKDAVKTWVRRPETRSLTLTLSGAEPQYTTAALQALVERGNALTRPLSVRLGEGGPVFTLTALQVANLFWVRPGGIQLDKSALANEVKQVAAAVDKPAQSARYALQGGALVKVAETAGVVSDLAQITALLGQAVLDPKISALTLTPKPSEPTIKLADLPDPGKLTLIASGRSTYYHSSPARRVNVANAATKINGAVVAPGETFSFLNALGGISPQNGFVTGLIISAGRTVDGLGGGVCQVSTTTFRALYQAGLPVVERNQHAYRVGYYEPQVGFEAAVYDPTKDLKMQNDTGGPLLIKTLNDNARSTLTVQVWGLPQARTVSVSRATILSETAHPAPKYVPSLQLPRGAVKQVDWAADGFNLYITRTIREGGKARSDTVSTHYKPWQAVYEVGQ